MFAKSKNAYMEDLNALRILMSFFFLCIYFGEGGGELMHVCTWEHIVSFRTEPLDGCLRNLVRMYSWARACAQDFRRDPTLGGSRAGQKYVN